MLALCMVMIFFRDETQAVLSLTFLPENGSTITVDATLLNASQNVLLKGSATVGRDYEGCLDQLIINNQQLPLLTPLERNVNLNTCGPRLPSETIRKFSGGIWLLGAGSYIKFTSQQLQSSEFDIQFYFRTFDKSGLLIFYPDDNLTQYLVIYLFEGKVEADYHFSVLHRNPLHLETALSYNTGLWYEIRLLANGSNVTMIVNGSEMLFGSSSQVIAFAPSSMFTVGGLPADYAVATNGLVVTSSISGCVHNLTVAIDGSMIDLQKNESSRVDLINGCPESVAPGVRFMGNGRAEFNIASQQLFNVSFAFRTTQLAALLLHFDGISVSLFHTRLRVDLSDQVVLISNASGLNDNTRHVGSILFSSSGNGSM